MKRIHRCPWCGEDTKNNKRGTYTYGMTCNSCNNKFVAYRKNIVYILLLFAIVLFVILSIIFDMPYFTIYTLLSLLINEWILSICPYVKESNKFVPQKRQFAELTIYNKEISHLYFYKYIIIENQIFTLCFVDKNDNPISHMICASSESIKWYKNQRKCKSILAFLPLGKLEEPYPADTKFYIFYNDKKIGEGITGKVLEGMNEYC